MHKKELLIIGDDDIDKRRFEVPCSLLNTMWEWYRYPHLVSEGFDPNTSKNRYAFDNSAGIMMLGAVFNLVHKPRILIIKYLFILKEQFEDTIHSQHLADLATHHNVPLIKKLQAKGKYNLFVRRIQKIKRILNNIKNYRTYTINTPELKRYFGNE